MLKYLSSRIIQEIRAHLPRVGQRPVLKTSFSWECAGFEQPRPADLTLSCTNIFKDILITFSCVFLSFLKLFKDTISNLQKSYSTAKTPKCLLSRYPNFSHFVPFTVSLYHSLSLSPIHIIFFQIT